MTLWLHVNTHSSIPIYVQLIDQVKRALEVGTLQPGDPLPSVRELASSLSIAPNTITRAYNELGRMGLIESRAGRGTVVLGEVEESLRAGLREALLERLRALVHDASNLGLSAEELRVHFEHAAQQVFPELQRQGD